LGGWKILIGHCPECCLDEMRRVRDEIEGVDRKKKKDKKKSKKSPSKKLERKESDERSKDGVVSLTSDPNHGGRPSRRHHPDGESEATSSTAQMSGGGSVVSEQYYRAEGAPGHHHSNSDTLRTSYSPHHPYQPPPPPRPQAHGPVERTMVLSMTFIDPQSGQRGTYTGQVNSTNHKPDGKGTVYFNDGTIAEGSWKNGILSSDSEEEDSGYERSRSYSRNNGGSGKHRSVSRNRNAIQEEESGFGNLHLLNGLPGAKTRGPRGGSASVQSYNSRTSQGHNVSGSASVQAGYGAYDGGVYGGGPQMGHYAPPPPRGRRVNSPPTMNKRGEYEP
jgi:hypothetical protein